MSNQIKIGAFAGLIAVVFLSGFILRAYQKEKVQEYILNQNIPQNQDVAEPEIHSISSSVPSVTPAMPYAQTSEDDVFVSATSVLIFAGDTMLSRNIGEIMQKKSDWTYPFEKISSVLREADFAFVNLEGPISLRGTKIGSIYSFRADPRAIEGLKYAGIDAVTIANNHIWDYGRDAFLDTIKTLDENGIGYAGGVTNYENAHKTLVKNIKGVRIAFLGYTQFVADSFAAENSVPASAILDEKIMAEDIKKAKEISDLVVVTVHWGEEYKTIHDAYQEKMGRYAIDAGASLVVGHHPHTPQDMEKYKDGYIAYSLGNFVFDQNFSDETRKGALLKTVFFEKRITSVELIPIKFTSDFQPYISGQ